MGKRIKPKQWKPVFLAAWREYKGKTQDDVADFLDCSPITVGRWERDERQPDVSTILAYAEAIEVEPGVLWVPPPNGDDDKPDSLDEKIGDDDKVRAEAHAYVDYLKNRRK